MLYCYRYLLTLSLTLTAWVSGERGLAQGHREGKMTGQDFKLQFDYAKVLVLSSTFHFFPVGEGDIFTKEDASLELYLQYECEDSRMEPGTPPLNAEQMKGIRNRMKLMASKQVSRI